MADPQSYPCGTIAKLLNITERRLQQLAAGGVIPRSERGRYPLVGAVRGYINYLQERAIGKDAAPTDVVHERGRLTKAQADKTELEVAELHGELVRVTDVADAWAQHIASARARLLSLPSKVAPRVAPPGRVAEAQELLRAIVDEALNELAGDGLPERARARRARASSVEGSAAADSELVVGHKSGTEPRKQRRARKVVNRKG